jgi:hypothetical protein
MMGNKYDRIGQQDQQVDYGEEQGEFHLTSPKAQGIGRIGISTLLQRHALLDIFILQVGIINVNIYGNEFIKLKRPPLCEDVRLKYPAG